MTVVQRLNALAWLTTFTTLIGKMSCDSSSHGWQNTALLTKYSLKKQVSSIYYKLYLSFQNATVFSNKSPVIVS